jgi:protein phosphatase
VADGVGGGPAGDLASATLVHRLTVGRLNVEDEEDLVRAVRGANWDLWAHTQRDSSLEGMATTLTGLVVSASGGILLVHSGDSRAYRLRDGRFTRQTRDDSLVQALVDRGIIAPHEAATHPRRNIVTASLGGGVDDGISVAPADAAIGDRWLLCSDGVSDYLPDDAIAEQLAAHGDAGAAAAAVVSAALEAGTRDTVTAVVCDVLDGDVTVRGAVDFSGAAAARFSESLDAAG